MEWQRPDFSSLDYQRFIVDHRSKYEEVIKATDIALTLILSFLIFSLVYMFGMVPFWIPSLSLSQILILNVPLFINLLLGPLVYSTCVPRYRELFGELRNFKH